MTGIDRWPPPDDDGRGDRPISVPQRRHRCCRWRCRPAAGSAINQNLLTLSDVAVTSGNTTVVGDGIFGSPDDTLRLTSTGRLEDLRALLLALSPPELKDLVFEGPARVTAVAWGTFDWPVLKGSLEVDEARLGDGIRPAFESVWLRGALDGEQLRLDLVEARWQGAHLALSGMVPTWFVRLPGSSPTSAKATISGHVDDVTLKVLEPFLYARRAEGDVVRIGALVRVHGRQAGLGVGGRRRRDEQGRPAVVGPRHRAAQPCQAAPRAWRRDARAVDAGRALVHAHGAHARRLGDAARGRPRRRARRRRGRHRGPARPGPAAWRLPARRVGRDQRPSHRSGDQPLGGWRRADRRRRAVDSRPTLRDRRRQRRSAICRGSAHARGRQRHGQRRDDRGQRVDAPARPRRARRRHHHRDARHAARSPARPAQRDRHRPHVCRADATAGSRLAAPSRWPTRPIARRCW